MSRDAGQAAVDRPAPYRMAELERLSGVGREAIRFYIRKGLLPEPERPSRTHGPPYKACSRLRR